MNDQFIFNFATDWCYKGVLSAEFDKKEVEKFFGLPPQHLTHDETWIVEILGFIWTDETGEWHMKMRLKFPSGNKQAFGKSFGKNSNETIVLQEMYRLPMVKKNWFRNKDGTFESLVKLMHEKNMIESMTIKVGDEDIYNYRG